MEISRLAETELEVFQLEPRQHPLQDVAELAVLRQPEKPEYRPGREPLFCSYAASTLVVVSLGDQPYLVRLEVMWCAVAMDHDGDAERTFVLICNHNPAWTKWRHDILLNSLRRFLDGLLCTLGGSEQRRVLLAAGTYWLGGVWV